MAEGRASVVPFSHFPPRSRTKAPLIHNRRMASSTPRHSPHRWPLADLDPAIHDLVRKEEGRQERNLELIASENIASRGVREAMMSVLTDKYAEGYPGNRYYGGCEVVDEVENLARDRVKELFGAAYANVQPHSGAQANMAVYFTFVKPGDTVMGMDLSHGGHLTHGSPVNFSGQLYRFVPYGVDRETGLIDYEAAAMTAERERPKMITVGASAYSRPIDYARFREIADSVGAFLFADIAHPAGLIAKGLLPSPLPHAHVVTSTTHKTLRGPRGGVILMGEDFENPFGIVAPKSGRTKRMSELLDSMVMPGVQGGPLMHVVAAKAVGFAENLQPEFEAYARQVVRNAQALASALMGRGFDVVSRGTENHLMLIDLRNRDVTGKAAQTSLDVAGITTNKNAVPFDDKPPLVTSGIRIGTPAVTTRGMREPEMELIAELIDRALLARDSDAELERVRDDVRALCGRFPIHAV
jgi:glycine hydroxymethyltransferase